ncbi:MAG: hypothetical protein ACTSQR_07885 [Promethearchaeota archaeon]
MGKTFGIISLLCGILGLFAWLLLGTLPFGVYYLPGAAIVFGIIGLIADESKGMSIAGLIFGIFDIVFILFILPMLLIFLILAGLGAILPTL